MISARMSPDRASGMETDKREKTRSATLSFVLSERPRSPWNNPKIQSKYWTCSG